MNESGISDEATALQLYRCIMNRIHEGGNIFYDVDRKQAYAIIAKLASDLRADLIKRYGGAQ